MTLDFEWVSVTQVSGCVSDLRSGYIMQPEHIAL